VAIHGTAKLTKEYTHQHPAENTTVIPENVSIKGDTENENENICTLNIFLSHNLLLKCFYLTCNTHTHTHIYIYRYIYISTHTHIHTETRVYVFRHMKITVNDVRLAGQSHVKN